MLVRCFTLQKEFLAQSIGLQGHFIKKFLGLAHN